MNVLCIDTLGGALGGGKLSMALGFGDSTVIEEIEGQQSGALVPLMERLFGKAGLPPSSVEAAVCLRGPGSFTGIRLGFAAIKGISAANGARLYSIPTLDCMAYSLGDEGAAVVPVIDSRRSKFYAAVYKGGKRESAYLDMDAASIAAELKNEREVLLTGMDAPLLAESLKELLPETELRIALNNDGGLALKMLNFFKNRDMLIKTGFWDGELKLPMYIRETFSDGRF